MSGGLEVLSMKEDDVVKFLAAGVHIGTNNSDFRMEQYIYKRNPQGVNIINLRKTWEKLLLAARAIAAIENPADVCVVSVRPQAQRAVLKFARYTGSTPCAGRFTAGGFTNHLQSKFSEPRLLVAADSRIDHQSITESSYVNIPVIAFCNTDAPMSYVDIGIPCNTKGNHALGLMWWMLAREVLRLRGTISRDMEWDVMPDLFFYRDPEEVEKEEQARLEESAAPKEIVGAPEYAPDSDKPAATDEWATDYGSTAPATDWAAEPEVSNQFQASAGAPAAPTSNDWAAQPNIRQAGAAPAASNDWAAQVSSATDDWSATAVGGTAGGTAKSDWGGSGSWE